MTRRAALLAAIAFIVLASVGAYLYYFGWTAPRLDPERVTAYAYGPRESHIRDLVVQQGPEAEQELSDLVAFVNQARLVAVSGAPAEDDFMVILLREDGLQYRLVPVRLPDEGEALVALSEGGQDFVGYLQSPELLEKVRELEERGDGLRTAG
jgi:hypothetical protein